LRPLLFILLCACALGCSLNSKGEGAEPGDASDDVLADGAPDHAVADGPCFAGSKRCGDTCVPVNDVTWGCASDSCGPACTVKHGSPKCSNGACKVDHCDEGWGDCDALGENGCETDLHTLGNCGACGKQCVISHGSGSCATGACLVLTCENGFVDCNADPADGCDGDLKSPENCGQCGHKCEVTGGGTPSCTAGVCGISSCPWGFGDCNADLSDGCETPTTTVDNCGTCGGKCQAPHAVSSCIEGACAIDHCEAAFGDCDANPATGCEIDLSVNPANCGACNAPCDAAHASNPACVAGGCHYACDNGFFDCNGPAPGVSDDGCEIEVAKDTSNCGACGRPCSTASVDKVSCAAGLCTSSCTGTLLNCAMPAAPDDDDGCETDVLTSPDHCGMCGAPCEPANAANRTCVAGLCAPECLPGFADCDGPKAGQLDNGCEIEITSDSLHCGACATPCPLTNAAGATCTAGICSYACKAGYADCNGPQPGSDANGCEQNILSDPMHCGGCGLQCGSGHVAGNTCAAGACTPTCEAGWADCDHAPAKVGGNNGCELNVLTNVDNCGGCGRPCSGDNVDTRSCWNGRCNSSCDATWKNCTQPSYPSGDNGCETWAVCL
jgi:hypothetical protein